MRLGLSALFDLFDLCLVNCAACLLGDEVGKEEVEEVEVPQAWVLRVGAGVLILVQSAGYPIIHSR